MVAQLRWDHNCIFLHIFPTTGASQLYVVANGIPSAAFVVNGGKICRRPRFAPVLR